MNIIIRAAKIIDTKSKFNNQVVDVLIQNGVIQNIDNSIENQNNFIEINLPNLHISQGWFDSSVSFGEPGFEDRETIENGLLTAAKSGFTDIALQPNTSPVVDNQSQIKFILSKNKDFATKIHPIGALTKSALGKDMAELFDMKNAGAIAFGDYNHSLENPNLLKIALQYAQDFDGLIIGFCQDKDIAGAGVINEGVVSTRLGLKGISNLAEEIIVARNLFLLAYTGGKLHIPTISTAKSVALIKEAKNKGLKVSCSVAVHHLILTDEKLEDFNTQYKVLPPLRTELDRQALIAGVLDGTIDMITSDHNPISIEDKKLEFDLAKFGTIGLETTFGALQKVLPLPVIIEKLTCGKSIFDIKNQTIQIGNEACLTFFNPEGEFIFQENDIISKSKNAIFLNNSIQGKVYGIYNQSKLELK